MPCRQCTVHSSWQHMHAPDTISPALMLRSVRHAAWCAQVAIHVLDGTYRRYLHHNDSAVLQALHPGTHVTGWELLADRTIVVCLRCTPGGCMWPAGAPLVVRTAPCGDHASMSDRAAEAVVTRPPHLQVGGREVGRLR